MILLMTVLPYYLLPYELTPLRAGMSLARLSIQAPSCLHVLFSPALVPCRYRMLA